MACVRPDPDIPVMMTISGMRSERSAASMASPFCMCCLPKTSAGPSNPDPARSIAYIEYTAPSGYETCLTPQAQP